MRLRRNHKHARIEMLPLMDVVFLILIFLVYAMMVMAVHMGMPVSLPASKSVKAEQVEALALTIQKDGELWLDKKAVNLESLPAAITCESHAKGSEELIVQIFADAALPYQKLFTVLDVLKKAGLKKISLQAKEDK